MTERPDIHTLTGAYACDALPADEREMFEQHLVVCDACAQEVAELQATAARLSDAAYELPSPGLRDRVLAEIDVTRQEPPLHRDGEDDRHAAGDDLAPVVDLAARRAAPRWVTGILGAAAAVLLVAVVGLSLTVNSLSDQLSDVEVAASQVADLLAADDVVTVVAAGPDGSHGRVVASPARGEAVFLVAGMAPAPHEHVYELWLIGDDGPVPAGLFDVDADGRATHTLTGDIANAAAIGVTVEPLGGSPQPTTDPVMVVELLQS